jgi:hypothetical protein
VLGGEKRQAKGKKIIKRFFQRIEKPNPARRDFFRWVLLSVGNSLNLFGYGSSALFFYVQKSRRIYESLQFNAMKNCGGQTKFLEENFWSAAFTSLPPHKRGQHSGFKFGWATLEALMVLSS